jgi:hypothetical protein
VPDVCGREGGGREVPRWVRSVGELSSAAARRVREGIARTCLLAAALTLAAPCASAWAAPARARTKSASSARPAAKARATRAPASTARATSPARGAAASAPAPALAPAAGVAITPPPPPSTEPAEVRVRTGPAPAQPPAGDVVKTVEARRGEKTYTFGAQEVEGRLKSPQILYFLRRVRAQFDPAPLGHRSFMLELSDTRRNPALE